MTASIVEAKQKIKYWWISVIAGLLAITVGVLSSLEPIVTIGILTVFFIANFLISGIIDIIFAIANRNKSSEWGWTLAGGLVNLLFAAILLALPIANMTIFIFYVAFYIMLQSFMQIWAAFSLKRYRLKSWRMFLALGIAGLILSLIMIFQIEVAISFITIIFSASLICYGLFRLLYGLRQRKLKGLIEEL